MLQIQMLGVPPLEISTRMAGGVLRICILKIGLQVTLIISSARVALDGLGQEGSGGGGPAPAKARRWDGLAPPCAVQNEGGPPVRLRPLPGARQGRPRGTRSRPRTEKYPLGSRSRASPPPAATTVPCIHTAVSSSGPRPVAARDSRHAPGPPSALRRSCSASTLSGGDRGSLTAAEPPLENESVAAAAAAIFPCRPFLANFDRQRGPASGHQSGALAESAIGRRREAGPPRPEAPPRPAAPTCHQECT